MSTDPREEKLPRWARDLLATERRARADAERLAHRAAILDRYDDVPIGLGEDPRVAFKVPLPGYRDEMSFIEVRTLHTEPGIVLHAAGEIVARQQSINVMTVVPWPKR